MGKKIAFRRIGGRIVPISDIPRMRQRIAKKHHEFTERSESLNSKIEGVGPDDRTKRKVERIRRKISISVWKHKNPRNTRIYNALNEKYVHAPRREAEELDKIRNKVKNIIHRLKKTGREARPNYSKSWNERIRFERKPRYDLGRYKAKRWEILDERTPYRKKVLRDLRRSEKIEKVEEMAFKELAKAKVRIDARITARSGTKYIETRYGKVRISDHKKGVSHNRWGLGQEGEYVDYSTFADLRYKKDLKKLVEKIKMAKSGKYKKWELLDD